MHKRKYDIDRDEYNNKKRYIAQLSAAELYRLRRNRLKNLLGPQPYFIYDNFRADEEGLESMTGLHIAEEICLNLMYSCGVPRYATITDAFAGIGGNTIAFAKYFHTVNAAEIDSTRFRILRHNLNLFSLCNVRVFEGPYQFIMKLHQDVIFFDPPWGQDYKLCAMGTARIFVDESYSTSAPCGLETIENLIIRVAPHANYIVVKLPTNYDFVYFESCIRVIGGTVLSTWYNRPFSSIIRYIEVRRQ